MKKPSRDQETIERSSMPKPFTAPPATVDTPPLVTRCKDAAESLCRKSGQRKGLTKAEVQRLQSVLEREPTVPLASEPALTTGPAGKAGPRRLALDWKVQGKSCELPPEASHSLSSPSPKCFQLIQALDSAMCLTPMCTGGSQNSFRPRPRQS